MSDAAPKRKPARWRKVPIRVFGRLTGTRHELWRAGEKLAVVAESLAPGEWYWVSNIWGSARSGGSGLRSLDEAKKAAKSYALSAEAHS